MTDLNQGCSPKLPRGWRYPIRCCLEARPHRDEGLRGRSGDRAKPMVFCISGHCMRLKVAILLQLDWADIYSKFGPLVLRNLSSLTPKASRISFRPLPCLANAIKSAVHSIPISYVYAAASSRNLEPWSCSQWDRRCVILTRSAGSLGLPRRRGRRLLLC